MQSTQKDEKRRTAMWKAAIAGLAAGVGRALTDWVIHFITGHA